MLQTAVVDSGTKFRGQAYHAIDREQRVRADETLPTLAHKEVLIHHLLRVLSVMSRPNLRRRILVVEDQPTNQRVAQKMLDQLNCNVVIADNGMDALTKIWENSEFDLIFMDCQMPIMDGFRTTEEIRNRASQGKINSIPIVALTAQAVLGDEQKCLEAGMCDYISKPFSLETLKSVVERWSEIGRDREVFSED